MAVSNARTTKISDHLRVIINNITIVGILSADIMHNTTYGAGVFVLTISLLDVLPFGLAQWAEIENAHVRIQQVSDELLLHRDLIEGYCDSIHMYPIMGIVRLEGRDRTAFLLDTKTPADFQNNTASEIVRSIALTHNLNISIATTTAFAGRQYGNLNNITALPMFSRLSTDWDVIVALAQTENFDAFIEGSTLYFQPWTNRTVAPQLVGVADLIELRMTKVLPLSRSINVSVCSWDSSRAVSVQETFQSMPMDTTTSSQASFPITYPNLSPQEAADWAHRVSDEVQSRSRAIYFVMSGVAYLDIRRSLILTGTGSVFDQTYQIQSIHRSFRHNRGYTQNITARWHSTLSN